MLFISLDAVYSWLLNRWIAIQKHYCLLKTADIWMNLVGGKLMACFIDVKEIVDNHSFYKPHSFCWFVMSENTKVQQMRRCGSKPLDDYTVGDCHIN